MLNVVVIGCGSISPIHCDAIKNNKNSSLYAVVDIDKARADAFAEKYNCKAFYNYQDALKDNNVDVVHICTPHYLHAEMSANALKADKHVLMEKPMAINDEQATKLIDIAQNSKKSVGVCFQNRYNTTSRKMKEFLNSGECGRILGAKAFITWHRDESYYGSAEWRGKWATEGGGVLINQAIHTIDLLAWFLGDVKDVQGSISTRLINNFIEVENTAEALIAFNNGANALLYATSCYCTDSPVEIEIVCEKARINLSQKLIIKFNDGRTLEYEDIDEDTGGKLCWGSSHAQLIEHFYNCLLNNTHFPIDLKEAYKALKIVLDIYN